jgi:hypothetical protein
MKAFFNSAPRNLAEAARECDHIDMKGLFRMVIDIGSEAPLATLGSVVSDLQAVGQASQDLAVHMAAAEAEKHLLSLACERGWPGILEEARLRQLLAAASENDQYAFDKEPPDRDAACRAPLTLGSSHEPWVKVADQLRSLEAQRLSPSLPYRFRSVRYDGVLRVEIISEHGIAALALGDLLDLVRTCRHQLTGDTADDASRASHRPAVRALASQRLSEIGLPLAPGAMHDLLPDSRVDAIMRLASQKASMEYSTFPATDHRDHPDNCED